MKFPARILFFVVSLVLFLFVFNKPTLAQETQAPDEQSSTPYLAPETNPDVPKNLHTFTQSLMISVTSSLTCNIAGFDPLDPNGRCLGVDPQTGKIGYVQGGGGALGMSAYFISALYTKPAGFSDYTRYLAGNFGIAKSAYAAEENCITSVRSDAGTCSIKPLIRIWSVFRNIVYILFALIFVVIGVGIMLRLKIDPRTVMTIENQIPRIIVGLILVTFSFAISGFLIDLMYASIYLVFSIANLAADPQVLLGNGISAGKIQNSIFDFFAAGGFDFPTHLGRISESMSAAIANLMGINQDFQAVEDPLSLVGLLTVNKSVFDVIINVISVSVGLKFGSWAVGLTSLPGLNLLSGGAATIGGYATSQVFFRQFLPYAIPWLILGIAVLISIFRTFFILLIAYISVLIDIVFAPLWIAAGILPESKLGFSGWLKDIIANLAVFPATLALILLAKIFIEVFGAETLAKEQTLFVPPLLGSAASTANILSSLIALGFIFMAPGVLTMIKAAIKAPGVNLGPVLKPVGAAGGSVRAGFASAGAFFARTPQLGARGGLTAVFRRTLGF